MKTIYLCGPTLYSNIHMGNARSLVFFDVLSEYYRRNGGVKYVRNITDFDDKIEAVADGDPAKWVTKNTLPQYKRDQKSLGLMPPDIEPRASDYLKSSLRFIDAMGDLITTHPDGAYFKSSESHVYGEISNRKAAGDFCVWKKNDYGIPSNHGHGKTGWHTECATMIHDIFGPDGVDIHGGGSDLKFPHHENENCQFHAVTGKHIAKEWLHVGHVHIDGKKMAKSDGNVMTVCDIAKDWSIGAIRTALLMTQFSKPINMSFERLREAEKIFSKSRQSAWFTNEQWNKDAEHKFGKSYITRI